MVAVAETDSSKLVLWSLIAAVVMFALFVALAVGSIVIQPKADGGGYRYQPEQSEVEEGGEMVVP